MFYLGEALLGVKVIRRGVWAPSRLILPPVKQGPFQGLWTPPESEREERGRIGRAVVR